ncbi:hypothetical protein AB0M28_34475 [Streptomyces sp. NPDC051940]|uniref:PqqD family protein n=1 Tax=Streptomyces sp. NPDC051940 TaxID=3155675 RepID=UPI0034137760
MTSEASGEIAIRAGSRIALHRLEARRDGAEWVVGRLETGEFVALPEVGMRALRLLRDGCSVAGAGERLRDETGEDVDVAAFAGALVERGFVERIDDRTVPQAEPPRPTLPRLRPRHVRGLLHPALPWLTAALVLAACVTLAARPELLPGYRGLLWSPHGSAVVALTAGAGWTLLLLHEFAHLAVARATGVPGRLRFGTRLQFLVLQTDISGIELAPRRHRLTAYLAGIAVNLAVAAAAVLALAALPGGPDTAAHRMLTALMLISLLQLPFQCMVFTRTDLYFVLQDLTRCHDLYGDGRAYAAYRLRALRHRVRPRGRPAPADPSAPLPRRERRAVRLYSVVLVAGTALCLTALALITLPAEYTLLAEAAGRLGPGGSTGDRLDGAAVLATVGGVHALWAVTWWRGRRRGRRTPPP